MRLRILLLFVLVSGLMAFNTMPSYALTTITIEDLSDGELVDLVDGNCQLREALQAIGDGSSDPDTSPDTVDGCTVAEDAGFEYIINFAASGTLVVDDQQFSGTMPEIPMNYSVTIDGIAGVTIDPPPDNDAFNMDSSRTMRFTNLFFLDATFAPRVPQLMPTFMSGSYTCANIPNAGTVVLVG